MKIWKQSTFIGFLAILALAFTLVACDDGNGNPQTAKWVSVDEDGDTWTLTITEKTGRFVYTPKSGDTYELEIDSASDGKFKSEGQVQDNTSGIIKLKPDNATETFEVTTTDDGMTSVSGTITFDDGRSEIIPSPYILTPSGGGTLTVNNIPSNITVTQVLVYTRSTLPSSSEWLSIMGTQVEAAATNTTSPFSLTGAGGKPYSGSGSHLVVIFTSELMGYYFGVVYFTNGSATLNWNSMTNYSDLSSGGGGDDMTWTPITQNIFYWQIGTYHYVNSIAYGDGRWVAVGDDKMATSTDGIIWAEITQSIFDNYSRVTSVAYGNNRWIAVGEYGKMATSTNGTTWTPITQSVYVQNYSSSIFDIAWGGNRWVAIGFTSGTGPIMATSTDGATWSKVTQTVFTGGTSLLTIAYGNNRWIATGQNGKMATSTDGTNWTQITQSIFGADDAVKCIAYSNNRWIAGGEGGMATSTNGTTWTKITDTELAGAVYGSAGIINIAYGNGYWFAFNEYGKMEYSTNGTIWDKVSPNPLSSVLSVSKVGIAYGNDKFVIGWMDKMAYWEP